MNSEETQTTIDKTLPSTESKQDEPETETKSKIEIYMNALVHSTNCTQDNCTFMKCLQFKRVTRHNKHCKKFINDRCEFCRQLIAISVYHAKNCTNHLDCLVPFCHTIKQKLEVNKSIDMIANFLNALKYKIRKSQEVQTGKEDSIGTNKRKYSSLESQENQGPDTSMHQTTLLEDCFKAKNDEMQQRKDAFYEKLREIKENKEPKNDNKGQLSKMNREKVFASFFQQILSNNPQFKESRTPRDKNYASLIVLLLRKEAELNEISMDSTSYLYLITEMFFGFDDSF
jgi:hypothetical protein